MSQASTPEREEAAAEAAGQAGAAAAPGDAGGPSSKDVVGGGGPADEALLLDHNYDGIQEYDNPMPSWWTWLFILTVVWSIAYIVLIETGVIRTVHEELRDDMAELRAIQAAAADAAADVDDGTLAALLADPDALDRGRAVFGRHCAVCHGDDGAGGIGSDLTDGVWEHGERPLDVHEVIKDGLPAKGMPGWQAVLSEDELTEVTAFTLHLSGETPDTGAGEMGAAEPAEAGGADGAAGDDGGG